MFSLFFFFFNDTATTEIYTLSLHDALPILTRSSQRGGAPLASRAGRSPSSASKASTARSEEHTSELQSRLHLVCRLLLEKKKNEHRCASLREPQREQPRTTHHAYV